ncbi:MAG: ribulokinase [Deltaproteobacteria bacterium]|nr:ribulokinase [Deltaproteobacteria bacterium]
MADEAYVVGIDFGTDSARTVIVDAHDGTIVSISVSNYPRWSTGLYCDASVNQFRQHPYDYLESMEVSVKSALKQAGKAVTNKIKGIAVDTTGSTPVLADGQGQPLALLPAFSENPNAMFMLWKDHTAVVEAELINELVGNWQPCDYLKYVGGLYSAEWFWAKALHIFNIDKAIEKTAVTLIEHCDWIPMVLTGISDINQIKRSRCAAGHKALWHKEFNGYPANDFLAKLHPSFPKLVSTFGTQTYTADQPFAIICRTWADKLGLANDVIVAVGAFDAHMGAVGGGIGPHSLLKVIGTSTCDMLVTPKPPAGESEIFVPGICGQVDGSIIPGMIGYEAGQSAFGDVYAWFKNILEWPLKEVLPSLAITDSVTQQTISDTLSKRILVDLEACAQSLDLQENTLVSIDWMNGRRTPDANHRLKGAICGISLGTDAPRIFKSLVEATAYGSRAITSRFKKAGVRIDDVIAIGGVATKSSFAMQVLADVLNLKVIVPSGEQSVALGAAMFAATAAGLYPCVEEAQKAMVCKKQTIYQPNVANINIYDKLYRKYEKMGTYIEQDYIDKS